MGIYDEPHLQRGLANHAPLTPLSFLVRAAAVYPDKPAVIHADQVFTYAQLFQRCRRLAGALRRRGIGKGDTVSVMAPNVPAMLEAHYGVAMAGAVLNALNYRLDAKTIAFIFDHAETKLLITDREFSATIKEALALAVRKPIVVDIDDPSFAGGEKLGETDYETFLASSADGDWTMPDDEWRACSLNYTSGTTGNPKGVVYHHRGAFLNAIGDVMYFGLSPETVYLWTLPMFHCNGWCYTWAVTAACGTHVCLRRIEPALIFALIEKRRVTHLCGAPIVLNLLAYATGSGPRRLDHPVKVMTGGAAPPSTIIANMERLGFTVTHGYGLTETYGPATISFEQDDWTEAERTSRIARQGMEVVTLAGARVVDPNLHEVPADGATIGEIALRANTVMKGYLKNPKATAEAFAGGWFHTGDLAVRHPDGYIEIKDRAKDIIISGGENISSLEVEEALYKHPAVMEAAVVARPDEKWGETPCAFVALKPDAAATGDDIIDFCRANLAHFKAPRTVVFGALPKTSTGKIQKYLLRERAKSLAP
jgi:fatty-acyl-CoA synthase